MIPRVIPCLLLSDAGLVKTVNFQAPRYIGDPINAVRIFNDKQADEIVVLDIHATLEGRSPDVEMIREVVSEAFMPVAYGGGVDSLESAIRLVQAGVEKVIVNTAAVESPDTIRLMTDRLGSSTVVISIDAARVPDGRYQVYTRSGTVATGIDAEAHAREMASCGAGEILLTSIDRDGTMAGYDLDLVRHVVDSVPIPVIANGGAGSAAHFLEAVEVGGAAAVAAGSLFVFHGRHRAVLITYPSYDERVRLFGDE